MMDRHVERNQLSKEPCYIPLLNACKAIPRTCGPTN
jgi:hypothetical protein